LQCFDGPGALTLLDRSGPHRPGTRIVGTHELPQS
jgi:hypothetical protein